jgi:2',3'-cyclic-nucleotide 2'-phosphodiesterase (5'-nucleotidase family)
MKKILSRLSILTTFVFVSCASTSCASTENEFRLTIVHTNDLHGMMLPFDYPGQEGSIAAEPNAGGLARRATKIKELRANADNPVVVVDTGDTFTRGPWHQKFYGTPEIESLNRMGYDFATVGNNEFKAKKGPESQAILLSLVQQSKFPWLAANLSVTSTGAAVPGIVPYVVRSYENVRVCYFGITAARSSTYPQTVGWTVHDPIETAKKIIPEARTHCEILIALTHIDSDGTVDQKLASEVQGIDAIVGGDSHIFREPPTVAKAPDGRDVPIAQSGEQGVRVGKLDLVFKKSGEKWRLKEFQGKLIPINSSTPEDPTLKTYIESVIGGGR